MSDSSGRAAAHTPAAALNTTASSHRRALLLVLVAAAVVCFGGLLIDRPLDEHECLVAETAREMRRSGDWIVPRFAGMPRIRKTPLGYWTAAAASLLTGELDERTARVPSAVAAFGAVCCLYHLGSRLVSRRTGLMAAFVGLTALALPTFAHDAAVDMQLTFCCTACYSLWVEALERRSRRGASGWFIAFYVAFGIALLAKFPMAGVVVGTPIAAHALLMLVMRRWPWADVVRLRIPLGLLIVPVIALPWPLLIWRTVPEAAWQWRVELLERFTDGERFSAAQGWGGLLFYPAVLAAWLAPWSLSLPEALATPFLARHRERRAALLLPWCWLIVGIAIVSVSSFRRGHYALPFVPALALLIAPALERLFFDPLTIDRRRLGRVTFGLALTVAAGFATAGVWVARELPMWSAAALSLAAVVIVVVALAGAAFVRGRRTTSLLLVGSLSVVTCVGLTRYRRTQPDVRADWRSFARRVAEQVPPAHEIRWIGRPDAVAVFYGAGRLIAPRLDDPSQLLRPTGGRFPGRFEWLQLVAQTTVERLRDARPVWLVIPVEAFGLLRSGVELPGYVALRATFDGRSDDVLLLTNQPIGTPAEQYRSERSVPRERTRANERSGLQKSQSRDAIAAILDQTID